MSKLILKFKDAIIREVPLTKSSMTIGRMERNDIMIKNMAVSRQHARIIHNEDRFIQLVHYEKGQKPRPVPFEPGDPVVEEISEFADCVKTGRQPETDGESALIFLSFIRAAIDSARLGKQVALEK